MLVSTAQARPLWSFEYGVLFRESVIELVGLAHGFQQRSIILRLSSHIYNYEWRSLVIIGLLQNVSTLACLRDHERSGDSCRTWVLRQLRGANQPF